MRHIRVWILHTQSTIHNYLEKLIVRALACFWVAVAHEVLTQTKVLRYQRNRGEFQKRRFLSLVASRQLIKPFFNLGRSSVGYVVGKNPIPKHLPFCFLVCVQALMRVSTSNQVINVHNTILTAQKYLFFFAAVVLRNIVGAI